MFTHCSSQKTYLNAADITIFLEYCSEYLTFLFLYSVVFTKFSIVEFCVGFYSRVIPQNILECQFVRSIMEQNVQECHLYTFKVSFWSEPTAIHSIYSRCEILTAMGIKHVLFWGMTPRSFIDMYPCLGRTCCLMRISFKPWRNHQVPLLVSLYQTTRRRVPEHSDIDT